MLERTTALLFSFLLAFTMASLCYCRPTLPGSLSNSETISTVLFRPAAHSRTMRSTESEKTDEEVTKQLTEILKEIMKEKLTKLKPVHRSRR